MYNKCEDDLTSQRKESIHGRKEKTHFWKKCASPFAVRSAVHDLSCFDAHALRYAVGRALSDERTGNRHPLYRNRQQIMRLPRARDRADGLRGKKK